jgi:hypothetical protein
VNKGDRDRRRKRARMELGVRVGGGDAGWGEDARLMGGGAWGCGMRDGAWGWSWRMELEDGGWSWGMGDGGWGMELGDGGWGVSTHQRRVHGPRRRRHAAPRGCSLSEPVQFTIKVLSVVDGHDNRVAAVVAVCSKQWWRCFGSQWSTVIWSRWWKGGGVGSAGRQWRWKGGGGQLHGGM